MRTYYDINVLTINKMRQNEKKLRQGASKTKDLTAPLPSFVFILYSGNA